MHVTKLGRRATAKQRTGTLPDSYDLRARATVLGADMAEEARLNQENPFRFSGCGDAKSTLFWSQLEELFHGIPLSQRVVLGGDLNGYVGEKSDELERVHGGFGYGGRTAKGNNILRTCAAVDLAIVNTYFKNKAGVPCHLPQRVKRYPDRLSTD